MKVATLALTAGMEGENFPVEPIVELAVKVAVEFVALPTTPPVANGTGATEYSVDSDDSDDSIAGLDHAYDDRVVVGVVLAFLLVTPTPQETLTGVVVPL